MEGSARRPDLVGTAFGAFLALALALVVSGVVMPRAGTSVTPGAVAAAPPVAAPAWAHEAAQPARGAIADGDTGTGSRSAEALPPLFTDGPRDLVPPAAHEPASLEIPRLAVRSPLLRLDKRADGTMEVPGDFSLAGWYVRGPAPGALGPAVIAGHLDSRRGAAVFARLEELGVGDEILVTRGDGQLVRFVVERTERYAKDAFPTEAVYGDTERPELRLITCDGAFDYGRSSYEDNLVVYAAADPSTLP